MAKQLRFTNGILNLQTNELREVRSDDNSLSTNINYIPYEDLSKDVLNEIMEYFQQLFPNAHIRQYVLHLLASGLGGISDHFIFCIGSGSNGKKSLIQLYKKAFGDYVGNMPENLLDETTTDDEDEDAEIDDHTGHEIETLRGIRLAVLQDPKTEKTLNTGIIKELVSHERINVSANDSFNSEMMLLCLTDRLPKLSSYDSGFFRRLRIIHFETDFVETPKFLNEFKKDRNLSMKFEIWKETFMSLLVHNYQTTSSITPNEVCVNSEIYEKFSSYDYLLENILKKKRKQFITEINQTCLNKEIIERVWHPRNYSRYDNNYFDYLNGDEFYYEEENVLPL